MGAPRFDSTCTHRLSVADRAELTGLARDVLGPSFDADYLARRWSAYPQVIMARDDEGLVAFELVDVRRVRGRALVYLGPLFSKRAAFVHLFAHVFERWLATQAPFCMGMEIESAKVLATLTRLLPESAVPRGDEPPPAWARPVARLFAVSFPHVHGLDLATLTTANDDPIGGALGGAPRRYRMALVTCDGSPEARERLGSELRRGLATMERRAATRAAVRGSGGHDLLRANS